MIGECRGASSTPTRLASAEVRIVGMVVMSVMPTWMIIVEIGIKPRIIPYMTVVIA
jgi:hypothetical protein